MTFNQSKLKLICLGINTYNEPIIYVREDCYICRSEGFEAHARVSVSLNGKRIIATLNTVSSDILHHNEASLSMYALQLLGANIGDEISVSHPPPLDSLDYIRAKAYGHELKANEIQAIIQDVVEGQLSNIDIAMFLTASVASQLNIREILDLTTAMLTIGERLSWPSDLVVDKHCVGGLPGNRTTLIVVPIVAAFGLMIPKTSSRAITSPAGTADTMEVFAPVNLDIKKLQKIVEQENGCIAWGGAVSLSPADDLLIRVGRALNLDSTGQLVASILSKKIAAGSTHLVIDMPIGETAKIRSTQHAELIKTYLEIVAEKFSLALKVMMTNGSQPVGRGIGPALEAKDVLAVLSCDRHAPEDLKDHALTLAAQLIEYSPEVASGMGLELATSILESKKALKKFEAICEAQGGGSFNIPKAKYTYTVEAAKSGKVVYINNYYIAQAAKLAGAPHDKAAGIEILIKLGDCVKRGQALFVLHAETKGELTYALSYINTRYNMIQIDEY